MGRWTGPWLFLFLLYLNLSLGPKLYVPSEPDRSLTKEKDYEKEKE